MPKVDEAYIEKKVTMILDAAVHICKDKPIYELTMKDIVDACYMSKGNIYRYFPDINAIIVAMVNRSRREAVVSLEEVGLFEEDDSLTIITKIIDYIVIYLEENMYTLGKIQMELMILMTCKNKNCHELMKVVEIDAGLIIFKRVIEELVKCVGEEKAAEFSAFLRFTVEGIVMSTVFHEYYKEENQLGLKPVSIKCLLRIFKETAYMMISEALIS
ncbi:TetR/AcrR family transcriptional regulator [Isobaculum melis]|uniref:Regulatory protein, tetR family n=1 Tax=Isobaculum melis TaxID=142588 RepID=A0A1H9S6R4_9LACT|nr:helix-turn-helix domain-containing protein [Isobaculum melis]SER80670.1 regulatory protein, tetR family [Isobaculum melis]